MERHAANAHLALVATNRPTDGGNVSSADGSWPSDEERGNVESESSSDGEYLPDEDSSVPTEWSLDKVEGLSIQLPHSEEQE